MVKCQELNGRRVLCGRELFPGGTRRNPLARSLTWSSGALIGWTEVPSLLVGSTWKNKTRTKETADTKAERQESASTSKGHKTTESERSDQSAEAGEARPILHRGQKSRNQGQLHPTGTKGLENLKEGTGPETQPKKGKRRKAKTTRHLHKKVEVRPQHAIRRSSGKEEDDGGINLHRGRFLGEGRRDKRRLFQIIDVESRGYPKLNHEGL
ncbi:hypothetical protein JTB14_014775 [Gonioctena quinquepunctata]|nr:hypothetical protein JTB14_014775 [Gonioctena quinquepunctata]